MASSKQIQLLPHHEIDKRRYDECIDNAINKCIYARSYYLDNICPQWKLLCTANYDWVMPVTWRKKWGIKYLYQPSFTQQLGIFYNDAGNVPFKNIVYFLKRHYRFWEININDHSIESFKQAKDVVVTPANNFILSLHRSYIEIEKQYNNLLSKNIGRSNKCGLKYVESTDYHGAIDLYKTLYGSKLKMTSDADYEAFKRICDIAYHNGSLICRKTTGKQDELLATVVLLKDGNRLYNIINCITAVGRKVNANHFLFDNIVKEFSNTELVLDFEGSDVPGIKSFYESFGTINKPYYQIKYNGLPWPIRLLK